MELINLLGRGIVHLRDFNELPDGHCDLNSIGNGQEPAAPVKEEGGLHFAGDRLKHPPSVIPARESHGIAKGVHGNEGRPCAQSQPRQSFPILHGHQLSARVGPEDAGDSIGQDANALATAKGFLHVYPVSSNSAVGHQVAEPGCLEHHVRGCTNETATEHLVDSRDAQHVCERQHAMRWPDTNPGDALSGGLHIVVTPQYPVREVPESRLVCCSCLTRMKSSLTLRFR